MSIINDAGDGNCMVLSQAETTTQSSTPMNGGKAQTDAQNDGQANQNQANTQNGGQNDGQANTNPNTGSKNQKRMIRERKL